jgi:hypothetical protein
MGALGGWPGSRTAVLRCGGIGGSDSYVEYCINFLDSVKEG